MPSIPSVALIVFGLFACLPSLTWELQAQTVPDSNWSQIAKPRLKAIYERGEFRAKRFNASWLADSSGYAIRERNSDTGESALVEYDVLSGERRSATSKDQPTNRGPLYSPDGGHLLEYRNRNLFVRDLSSGQSVQLTERPEDRDVLSQSGVEPRWLAHCVYRIRRH